MNVLEAIKSGKRFRLPTWNEGDWAEPDEGEEILRNMVYEALISEDWEIEQQVIPLTKTQIYTAWSKMIKKCLTSQCLYCESIDLPAFLQLLGFDE